MRQKVQSPLRHRESSHPSNQPGLSSQRLSPAHSPLGSGLPQRIGLAILVLLWSIAPVHLQLAGTVGRSGPQPTAALQASSFHLVTPAHRAQSIAHHGAQTNRAERDDPADEDGTGPSGGDHALADAAGSLPGDHHIGTLAVATQAHRAVKARRLRPGRAPPLAPRAA